MVIDFGCVTKYFDDRGFGFVSRTFTKSEGSDVFFHISKVIRSDHKISEDIKRQLVGADEEWLYGGIAEKKKVCFWYGVEKTEKGDQVVYVWELLNKIDSRFINGTSSYVKMVQDMWADLDVKEPLWLYRISVDLLGKNRADSLRDERIGEFKRIEEEAERVRIEEELKRKKEIEKKLIEEREKCEAEKARSEEEEAEFQALVSEMRLFGFTQSSQVSAYIMRNNLGLKYKRISGVLTMQQEGRQWEFKGGFPPHIYARLCEELELSNKGTNAKVIDFESFDGSG